MRKKILSAVAAGVVAVGMIGCGGGSGSSANNQDNNGGQGQGTITQQPVEIKGIDGYVMNAKLVVKYWDPETNETKEYTIKDKSNYYLTADSSNDGKRKKGEVVYSLSEIESNKTIFDNIVSIELQGQKRGTLDDNSIYFQSFFDADGDREYNASNDELMDEDVVLKAPKGFSVVTPVTTIIAKKVEAVLNDDKNESNLTAVIDLYTEKMAKALGVTEEIIKSKDPLELKDATDERLKAFVLVNAMLGAVVAENKDNLESILDELNVSTPTTAEEVIENAAKIAEEAGNNNIKEVLNAIKEDIKATEENLDRYVKKLNLDKTRERSKDGDFDPVAFETKQTDFNLSGESIEATKGYKIEENDLEFAIKLNANDKNISTKRIYFIAKLEKPRDRMEQGDDNLSAMLIKVPVDINATDRTVNAKIGDAKIKVDALKENGTMLNIERNLTALNLEENNVINISNGKLTFKLANLVKAIDNNLSNEIFGGSITKIYNMQVGIKDSDMFTYVSEEGGITPVVPALDKISLVSISENVVSLASFKDDTVVDLRAQGLNEPRENKEPDNGVMLVDSGNNNVIKRVVDLSNGNAGADLDIISKKYANTDTNESMRLILKAGENYKIKVTPGSDWWENNLSLTVDVNNNFVEENDTRVKEFVAQFDDGFTDNFTPKTSTSAILTVGNNITGEGNKTVKLTFKFTDEFGESNETTLYAVVDRNVTLQWKDDNNKSKGFKKYKDDNNTALLIAKELDGFQEIAGDIKETNITIYDYNGTEYNLTSEDTNWTVLDVNSSGYEVNVTLRVVDNRNLVLDFNDTLPVDKVIGKERDWNVTISRINVKITGVGEYNGTMQLRGDDSNISVLYNPATN